MRRILPLFLILLLGVPMHAARQPLRARHGMVVAMESIAAEVGVSVLQKGGNAVDAAVAVGFALAVTHPFAGNLGGGGYMLIRLADGRTTFIDFRERAPQAASRNMYLDANGTLTKDSIEGWRSSGVPGTVSGFEMAISKYGRRTWADNMAPAYELASKGFPVSYALAEGLKGSRNLASSPESKRIFQKNGAFYDVGETLAQPELAQTLARISANGAKEFYEGETATRFAAEMAKNGGLITLADLKSYKALERTPLTGTYRSYTIITSPPSSSGGIALLEMLGILDGTGYEKGGAGSASAIHYAAESMRRAYADRNEYVGDPNFVKVPIAGLLDPAYVATLRATIDPERATPSARVRPGRPAGSERMETTHYSVVDGEGNAVAVTYTLNGGYGNGITVPGLGFLLNNEMDDFSSKPGEANMFGLVQGEANAIQPGKRPLSSMTPTIILKDGALFMTAGAPGGPRISTAVLQVILNVLDFGMNVQDAIDFPRFHHQWQPDRLSLERGISPDTVALLKARGHDVDYSDDVVLAQVAAIVSDGGWLQGGSDGRSAAGKASGY
ncbi:MAG: gamma-glutamyltransferase [Acidobacteria bacterium RIFCSPLOWO2_12_FULL_66_10]|nr:MAG: gamma-glutamyltransferase [Acidobacteria bacterium RIFCSPLOWO2_12_FULL_66_10]